MRSKHYSEFSVNLRYRTPGSGSYPRVDTPGYYLTAGWSNEGEAEWPLDNKRLAPVDFSALLSTLEAMGPSPVNGFVPAHTHTREIAEKQAEFLAALRSKREEIDKQIKKLEAR